jgi:RNA polymerase sigma factor (TIGR02999 family)
VTELLLSWSRGDEESRDRLIPLVYDDLRRLAASYLRRERPDHTLGATALVHETYLRLVDQKRVSWQNRAHFLAVSAQLMRRILVDHARSRQAAKRGGGVCRLTFDEKVGYADLPDLDLAALDEALTALTALDPEQGRIVEVRFFGGLSIEETAEALGLTPARVKREWNVARAWLYRRLKDGETASRGAGGSRP